MENKKIEKPIAILEVAKDTSVTAVVRKRLAHLLSVKSIVTLVLTAVFGYMAVTENISQDFMTIYAVIIAFYFGTQSQKVDNAGESGENHAE